MASIIPHIDDNIEQKRQRFLEKAGQIVFVCGDAETNVTIAAGKSFGGIQSEELGGSFIDLDGLRKRTGSWMREDGSELVPPNEHLLVNLDRPLTAICEYLRHLDRRHHLVVNPQCARTNPFRRSADHDVPEAVHAMVTEPVSIVSEDTVSRCHSDWDHAVCSHLQEGPSYARFEADRTLRNLPWWVRTKSPGRIAEIFTGPRCVVMRVCGWRQRVGVATRHLIRPFRNSFSTRLLCGLVNPAWWNAVPPSRHFPSLAAMEVASSCS